MQNDLIKRIVARGFIRDYFKYTHKHTHHRDIPAFLLDKILLRSPQSLYKGAWGLAKVIEQIRSGTSLLSMAIGTE